MLNINKKLIDKNYSKGEKITPKYIVIHETANTNKGADAQAHYRYWGSNSFAKASAHFVVDDHEIVQLGELWWKMWHVGDNSKGYSGVYNSNSIGIEICVNSDGNYEKARQNAIDLAKYIMKKTGITADRVIRHKDASGKNCPAKMLAKPQLWQDFKGQLVEKRELTSPNDIVWELGQRGFVTDKQGMIDEMSKDLNGRLYWLARKVANMLRGV